MLSSSFKNIKDISNSSLIVNTNLNFEISQPTQNLIIELLEYSPNIYIEQINTELSQLGTGRFDSELNIEIGINPRFAKYSDEIISHELIHLIIAFKRRLTLYFKDNDNCIPSLIFSAFEHPTIVKTQKEIGINIDQNIKEDLEHNLKQLELFNNEEIKQNNNYIKHCTMWADRANWGFEQETLNKALLLVKQFPIDKFNIYKLMKRKIANYTNNPTPENFISGINEVFSYVNLNDSYEITKISQQGVRAGGNKRWCIC